jgi:RNA polymerase sigma-70 factor (ECF subfamily)
LAPKREFYARSPEALVVGLARKGDRAAFAELVKRRQGWIRNLLRRLCADITLADDLAQQAFLQAWRNIPRLQRTTHFGAWLKRIAVNTWLQHVRRNDPLRNAGELPEAGTGEADPAGVAMDLDGALAELAGNVRLCIVLAYHERMTHEEIAAATGLPLGTVKSHIRRGTARLQRMLSAYAGSSEPEESS